MRKSGFHRWRTSAQSEGINNAPNLPTISIYFADREGRGVKKYQNYVDVTYESPKSWMKVRGKWKENIVGPFFYNTFFFLLSRLTSSFVSVECKNSPPDWIPTSVSISVTRRGLAWRACVRWVCSHVLREPHAEIRIALSYSFPLPSLTFSESSNPISNLLQV